MFKNIIIIILVFLLCSLLFQNKENVNLLVKDLADTKELVVDGADYVKKTFEKEFSEVVVESTEDDPFSLEKDSIKEETFFEEKK
jgi:hypothetical protein